MGYNINLTRVHVTGIDGYSELTMLEKQNLEHSRTMRVTIVGFR